MSVEDPYFGLPPLPPRHRLRLGFDLHFLAVVLSIATSASMSRHMSIPSVQASTMLDSLSLEISDHHAEHTHALPNR